MYICLDEPMRTLLNIDAFPLHRTLAAAPCSKRLAPQKRKPQRPAMLAGLPESARHLICLFLDVFTMGRLKFVQTDFMPRAMLQQLRHYYLELVQRELVPLTRPWAALGTGLAMLVAEPMEAIDGLVYDWPGCPTDALVSVWILGRGRRYDMSRRHLLRTAGLNTIARPVTVRSFSSSAAAETTEAEPMLLWPWERLSQGMDAIEFALIVFACEVYHSADAADSSACSISLLVASPGSCWSNRLRARQAHSPRSCAECHPGSMLSWNS